MEFANGFIEIDDYSPPAPSSSSSLSAAAAAHRCGVTPPLVASVATCPHRHARASSSHTPTGIVVDLTDSPPASTELDLMQTTSSARTAAAAYSDEALEQWLRDAPTTTVRPRPRPSTSTSTSSSSSLTITSPTPLAGSHFGGDARYHRVPLPTTTAAAEASSSRAPMPSSPQSTSAMAPTTTTSPPRLASSAQPDSRFLLASAHPSTSRTTGFSAYAQAPTRSSTLPTSFAPSSTSRSSSSSAVPLISFAELGAGATNQNGAQHDARTAGPITFASQRLPGQVASPFRMPAQAIHAPVAGPSTSRSNSGSSVSTQANVSKSSGSGSTAEVKSKSSSADQLKAYYKMQSASVAAARHLAQGRPGPAARSGTYPGFGRPMVPLPAPRPPSENGINHPQQHRNGKAPATSSSTVIDLTDDDPASDPDDVIVDDRPICIGQITTLALILYPISELQPSPAIDAQGRPVPVAQQLSFAQQAPSPLPVHIYRGDTQQGHETLKLISPKRKETFGVVEHRVSDVIAPLLGDGWSGTGVTANGKGKIWCEAAIIRKAERNPTLLPLALLLFARPFDVPGVAATLERNLIYLEHPSAYDPNRHGGARYSNPHNPSAASGRGGADLERRRQQYLAGIYGASGLGATRVVTNKDEARLQVDEVFKSLKSVMELDEVEPPPMVTTKLYPHQKQALSFLLDREKVHVIPEKDEPGQPTIVSLWSRESDTYGRPVGWKSVVADLKIPGADAPPQTRGAILADDMGLGKTIAVIALVATTLDDARQWARNAIDRDQRDSRVDSLATKAAPTKLGVGDFSSRAFGHVEYGEPTASASTGKPLSKKKLAAVKREQRREDALSTRFKRLVLRSRATLIVCPLSTVQNWESQFDEHTGYADGRAYRVAPEAPKFESDDGGDEGMSDGSEEYKPRPKREAAGKAVTSTEERAIKIYVYHGNQRIQDPARLADYDVVITTFSTLGTEYSKQSRAEEEKEADEEAAARSREDSSDEALEVYALGPNGEQVETKPGDPIVKAGKAIKPKRKRRRVEGDGASPLQQIEWYRVVLDEAHIIKEHTTIQARAACELATPRRIALSGTPLQNSLNDLFSLVRFLRLEPFTDRAVWTQHIGALAKVGDPLGVDRLQLIMRHLALRRTKESTDKDGKPILSLPPNKSDVVELQLSPEEHAFYQSHHQRYKHDFAKLEETDSVMKNYCSILQELLRLRQICVHPALVRDSEDANSGGTDLVESIKKFGISKQRAIPLLLLMRDAGGGQCSECGTEMLPVGSSNDGRAEEVMDDEGRVDKKAPVKKSRKMAKSASVSVPASETDDGGSISPMHELRSVVTRCQHLFCRSCFITNVYNNWASPKAQDQATCSVCKETLKPALDAVEIGAGEFERATDNADKGDVKPSTRGGKKAADRVFEHSTKTLALVNDLLPFSQANPASVNFRGDLYCSDVPQEGESKTIGFQPIKGDVVKSVVFSQWTKYLDRLGDALDSERIKYRRLDGGMDRDARSRAMDAFKAEPACEVLLVSLRAGGVGLNLTAGRRVYLMEPFWNPAVENQAVDRIHRLGQTMPVQTVRFIIKTSIEENMRKIQKRKMDLANMSVKKTVSKAELLQQRKDELAILMS